MKFATRTLLAVVVLLSAMQMFAQQAAGNINGVITMKDGAKEAPAAGVKIAVTQNGKAVLSLTSDADGKFSTSVPAGVYTLDLTSDTCYPASELVIVAEKETASVAITMNKVTEQKQETAKPHEFAW